MKQAVLCKCKYRRKSQFGRGYRAPDVSIAPALCEQGTAVLVYSSSDATPVHIHLSAFWLRFTTASGHRPPHVLDGRYRQRLPPGAFHPDKVRGHPTRDLGTCTARTQGEHHGSLVTDIPYTSHTIHCTQSHTELYLVYRTLLTLYI